jgi:succinoglycan biosynthesis transport protein ExoP
MSLNRQLYDLQLQRDGLLVRYTEGHPTVKEVQVKINQLGRRLVSELLQRQVTIERTVVSERVHLENLRSEYNELPSKGLELSRLEREVDMHQEIVTILEEQYQTALIREADQVQHVAILQSAITPSQPINPMPMIRRGVIGIVLGLILGVVSAVVAETLDTSIGTIEDVQEYTGTQVVGLIPYINVEDVRSSLERRGGKVEDERTVQRKAQLVAYFDPQSTLAESYRILRTNIDFVTVEKGAKCLMITSSTNQEGKSTTSANLAMSIAQFGQRVLLVDGDLRRPTLNRLFGLEREPGLTEVIIGNFGWRDVVRTVTDIVTGGMGMKDVFQTPGNKQSEHHYQRCDPPQLS